MSVRLRRLRVEDGARVLAWRNSPEVAAHMYADHLIGEAEHARWLAAALGAGDCRYWIVEWEGGAPVGLANLVRLEGPGGKADWAFYLADPATRGRGLGSAVEYLVIRHAFEALGLRKLCCEVLVENAGVIALHERFGFVREALYRQHVVKGGRPLDVVGLAMLAGEWPAARLAAEARLRPRFDLAALALEA